MKTKLQIFPENKSEKQQEFSREEILRIYEREKALLKKMQKNISKIIEDKKLGLIMKMDIIVLIDKCCFNRDEIDKHIMHHVIAGSTIPEDYSKKIVFNEKDKLVKQYIQRIIDIDSSAENAYSQLKEIKEELEKQISGVA